MAVDTAADEPAARKPGWRAHFHRVKGWVVAAAGLGAVLSGLVGYYNTYRTVAGPATAAGTAAGTAPGTTAARPSAAPLSILVLPFANQTGDAQKAYVADALTATVTADLSRLTDAYIVPTATALTFRDRNLTVQQVGAEAGVRFVLQGSVLSSAQKVRLTAQLSDTQSGALVWNETVEGDITDLFALQDKVTTGIGISIRREMIVRAARESETRKTSPAAADLTLRARALTLKPRSLENFVEIEKLLRQALVLEPQNMYVMGSLAGTLATAANNFGRDMGPELREKKYAEARELALKGVAADPERSSNHAALAMHAFAHDDYPGAVRAAERALALSARSPQSYNLLASIVVVGEDPRRAVELCEKAIALDPLHVSELVYANQGWGYMRLGEYDAAIQAFNKSLEKNPSLPRTRVALVLAHSMKGDDARARALAAEAVRDFPRTTLKAYWQVGASEPPAYKDFVDSKLVPAWRKAGLPE